MRGTRLCVYDACTLRVIVMNGMLSLLFSKLLLYLAKTTKMEDGVAAGDGWVGGEGGSSDERHR